MNSIARVFSNFKEFYSEINGATLTGAIDVIVVEQPDGEFQCSPFHVRFGKLGVLRSREKVVDIEINGDPVDIHMKLGESGEAFFVEECPEDDAEALPDNLATSPIPNEFHSKKYDGDESLNEPSENLLTANDDIALPIPMPRRNSIDFSKETVKKDIAPLLENQISDYTQRRHTDNVLERPNISEKLKEYTTQKLRQEWAEHEEIFQLEVVEKEKEWSNSTQSEPKVSEKDEPAATSAELSATNTEASTDNNSSPEKMTADDTLTAEQIEAAAEKGKDNNAEGELIDSTKAAAVTKEDSKEKKKKRRRKLQIKKKNAQRKSSSSSSLGSSTPQDGEAVEADSISIGSASAAEASAKASAAQNSAATVQAAVDDDDSDERTPANDKESEVLPPITPTTRLHDLDIHFFSDTEVTPSGGAGAGRPSTPVQSDSELELSMREKPTNMDISSASWKWGELPEDSVANAQADGQAQRNSMLSSVLNFMKKTNKIRHQQAEGGVYLSELERAMDPAIFFPETNASIEKQEGNMIAMHEDDRESGNGTSLTPSSISMEGGREKSVDSDYDEGKGQENKTLDFVAMSLCGNLDKGEPTDEEFDRNMIKYSDVCENPSLFASPNLYVRLNGKYYTWAAACPIVMTMITFQKPLTDEAIEQLMTISKQDAAKRAAASGQNTAVDAVQSKRFWWWRRSQSAAVVTSTTDKDVDKTDAKLTMSVDADNMVTGTQTTRPNTPDISENTLSKTDSTLNAENTSAMVDNLDDLSQTSLTKNDGHMKNERYKKSLRLSSEAIKKLNLKDGMNEIVFSVTTAYQGTTRCKCYLFRWKHSDKVVISDIDGTITKSDVLGHILPMVGKDWAQIGVAQLFSKIEQNGYKLLYLSARAIGQSRVTREYLRSVRQGDVKLPDGPLLLNPTSLISAFHREVIERKPEQFKIACLTDIRDLFPDKQPFYAGYGNRINDVWAYRAVGIPIMRIFTINTKGELKHELTQTFQSSGYINQSLEVDEYFPVLNVDDDDEEYLCDVYDDDEEVEELKFSESNADDDDDDEDEVFSDDYVDDGIVLDEELFDSNSNLNATQPQQQRESEVQRARV